MPPFISEEQVEKALDYLRDSAEEAAEARAQRSHLEDYVKSLEAILMKESDDGKTSAAIQKRNALSHTKYLEMLVALREAVKRDEKYRYMRGAAQARIDAWQTLSANYRGMRV
jgi:type I site-specific restriction-modification system R (restriction) subunit